VRRSDQVMQDDADHRAEHGAHPALYQLAALFGDVATPAPMITTPITPQ
jgi:hypothetical protein